MHKRIAPPKPQGLKRLRPQAGLSRRQLAEMVGVVVSTLVTWEQGLSLPLPATLAKLAGTLGLPVEKLREEMQAVWKGRRKGKRKSVQ
jgi:transcriptional regulator with XRE-family HTH domain